jgi:hypothetical protein
MMRVDSREAEDYQKRIQRDTSRVINRAMRDMVRDARDLARAHVPHNMDRKDIASGSDGRGAYVKAEGGPAAYDAGKGAVPGGPIGSTFDHPVFASNAIPRNQWHWRTQRTHPFIELAVEEVERDADLVISVSMQAMLDEETV